MLVQPGSTPFHHNLRLLKTNFVKAVLSAVPPANPPATQLPYIDMQRCRDREEKAIRVRRGGPAGGTDCGPVSGAEAAGAARRVMPAWAVQKQNPFGFSHALHCAPSEAVVAGLPAAVRE